MNRSTFFLVTFLAMSAVGCATMSVKTDYDRNLQLPAIRTFAWIEQPAQPDKNPIVHNSLMDRRIKEAVDRELATLAYEKNVESPALLVVYHTDLKDVINVQSYGYSYGRYYGRYGGGGPYLRSYKQGTLILDFVDPETKHLIWRGWAVGAFDDENAAVYVNKAVRKIMKKFPLQDDKPRT